MDHGIKALVERYALTPREHEQIKKSIIDIYPGSLKAAKAPMLVILAAQPGAGKTELEKLARKEQGYNIAACNIDNLRDFHPLAGEIKKIYQKHYPEITTHFAHDCTLTLLRHCRQNRLSYMLETTMQNGPRVNSVLGKAVHDGRYGAILQALGFVCLKKL